MASMMDRARARQPMPDAEQAEPAPDAEAPEGEAPEGGAQFTPKDPKQFVPEEQHDAIDRVVAAGVKLMYAPEMADERMAAVQDQGPMPKRIADNITGLMLTLDQRAKGGIPQEVVFPAAVILTNEAANLLVHAGQTVTQNDYNEALQLEYVQIGKKLGASDDQLMQGAQDALAKQDGGMDAGEQLDAMGPGTAPAAGQPVAGVQTAPPMQGGA